MKLPNVQWNNSDNQSFYNELSISQFKNFARNSGLDNCEDLQEIFTNIVKSLETINTILEIGAGYGRVIEGLIASGFRGAIYALEYAEGKCEYLRNKFKSYPNVHIICSSITSFPKALVKIKFDLVLWLWSGISDFPVEVQRQIIKKIKPRMHSDSYFIIDVFRDEAINSKEYSNQYYQVEYKTPTKSYSTYGYNPTAEEMESCLGEAGFKWCQKPYTPQLKTKRAFYVLQVPQEG